MLTPDGRCARSTEGPFRRIKTNSCMHDILTLTFTPVTWKLRGFILPMRILKTDRWQHRRTDRAKTNCLPREVGRHNTVELPHKLIYSQKLSSNLRTKQTNKELLTTLAVLLTGTKCFLWQFFISIALARPAVCMVCLTCSISVFPVSSSTRTWSLDICCCTVLLY